MSGGEFGQVGRAQEEEGPVGKDSRFSSMCYGKLRSNGIGFAYVLFWPSDAHSVNNSCFVILSSFVHTWPFSCITYMCMYFGAVRTHEPTIQQEN